MHIFSKTTCILALSWFLSNTSEAQNVSNNEYQNVINGRAYKIVATLDIPDSAKFYRVRDIISKEYAAIKKIDDVKSETLKQIKSSSSNKERINTAIKKFNEKSDKNRTKLNAKFVKSLSKELNSEQVEKVKNGLTYNVLPITYQAHLDMIPSLKEEEKKYIYNALYEARELAMAAGSSNEKHAWFGKYKGRINNYLTAKGYNLTKEREAWYERIKAQKK